MASESPQIEKTPPQSGPGDQPATPTAETAKRKAEQTNGTQTRTKRNRYISIAWYDYGLIRSDVLCLGLILDPFAVGCGRYYLQCQATLRSLWWGLKYAAQG